jgi:SAM-dependent methyltransferase
MADNPSIDRTAFKDLEREGYSRVAARYDEAATPATSQVNNAILNAVGARQGTRLLDVACGPGWLSAAAVARGAVVTGLDFAESMLALARARCPQADFRNGDAEQLPFDQGRYEAVVCSFGLLHFPDPERAVAEALRVLQAGGRYAFTCWTPPARNPFMGLIFGAIQTHGTTPVDLPAGPPLFRFGESAECEKILSAAGFLRVSVVEVPVVWPFPSPEEVMPMVAASTARIGPWLTLQQADQRRRIADAIAEGARQHTTARGVEIPSPALLAVGCRP